MNIIQKQIKNKAKQITTTTKKKFYANQQDIEVIYKSKLLSGFKWKASNETNWLREETASGEVGK